MIVWMSFADEHGFLGATMVSVDDPSGDDSGVVREAVRRAWDLGLNLGGEVPAVVLPDLTFQGLPETIREALDTRLLRREELEGNHRFVSLGEHLESRR